MADDESEAVNDDEASGRRSSELSTPVSTISDPEVQAAANGSRNAIVVLENLRTPRKEAIAIEKPLALRKTPRAAAGSNMYRRKKPHRAISCPKTTLDSSSASTGSPIDAKPPSIEQSDTPDGPESVVDRSTESVPASPLLNSTPKGAAPKGRKRKNKSAIQVVDATDGEPHQADSGTAVKRSRKLPPSAAGSSASSPSQAFSVKEEIVDDEIQGGEKGDGAAEARKDGDHDEYCWVCHRQCTQALMTLSCDVCPRSYHTKCLVGQVGCSIREEAGSWVCPECRAVLRAENTDTRSPAMQMLDLEQLCSLLKFALARMKVLCPVEFLQPVDLTEFPTYQSYVVHPMDVGMLESNLKERMYGSTESFLADAKWLQHNCVVFNGQQHKLSTMAKSLLKVCRQEMAEIEVCPDCYRNAHTKRGNWFVEPCNLPHLLIWAKLKGFPFWPGKAMRIVSGSVDVRFFGAHDRAWISLNQCYLLSKTPPTNHKNKKRMFEQSMEELESHIRRLQSRFGSFEYSALRVPLVEQNVLDSVRAMLPQFEDPTRIERFLVTTTKAKTEDITDTTAVTAPAAASDNPPATSAEVLVVATATTSETSNLGEDNASDSTSRSSQQQQQTSSSSARPREESVRNLESTIARIFRKNKAKKSYSDKESGDENSTPSFANFSAAIAATSSPVPFDANSNGNSNSGESGQNKREQEESNADGGDDCADNDQEEAADEQAAENGGAPSDENSKTGDERDCSAVNGDGGSDSGGHNDDDEEEEEDDDDEEGGLVIDTSTEEENNATEDETEDSKVDDSSQVSDKVEVPEHDDEENDDVQSHNDEEEDEEMDEGEEDDEEEEEIVNEDDVGIAMSLPILERHLRQGTDPPRIIRHGSHSKKKDNDGKPKEDVVDSAVGGEMVRRMRLELDRAAWQHRQELAEARHNADLVLLEMRRSLEAEKAREVSAMRRQFEQDKISAVREAKRRQWCAVCLKESSLMCCWNTSYCDYPCQRKHWPLHVSSCSQYKLSSSLSVSKTDDENSEADEGAVKQ